MKKTFFEKRQYRKTNFFARSDKKGTKGALKIQIFEKRQSKIFEHNVNWSI